MTGDGAPPNPPITGADRATPLLLLLVAVWTLGPSWARFGAAIPGDPTSDAYDHLWGYWWWFHALGHGMNPLHDALSHQPPGGALWFVDPVGALLAAPFQLVIGAAAATVLMLTLQVWTGLLAVWLGLRREAPHGAIAAAVAVAASAYVMGLLQSGVYEFVGVGPLAGFYLALRAGAKARWCAALWLLCALGNFYYAAFAGLLALVALAEGRVGWRAVARVAALALPPIAAVAGLAWTTLSAPDAVVRQETAPSWAQGNLPAVDPSAFVRWGAWFFPDNARMGNVGIVHVAYIGWAAIVLAAVGLGPLPRRAMIAVSLALVFALGPALAWNQHPVRIGGHDVWMPLAALYVPGSPLRFVHHPYRLVAVLLIALSPAIAAGAQRLAARAGRAAAGVGLGLALAVLLDAHLLSPAAAASAEPLRSSTAPVDPGVDELDAASRPEVTGVWNFPPDAHHLNRRYEMLAIFHHKAIPYGVNSFLPSAWTGNGLVQALLRCLPNPQRQGIPREGGPPPRDWFGPRGLIGPTPSESEIAAGASALRSDGYSDIVLDPSLSASSRGCATGILDRVGARSEPWARGPEAWYRIY